MTRNTPSTTRRSSSTAPDTSARTPTADGLEERAAIRNNRGRSGGIVDAPGKKHRPPTPPDAAANRADNQAAKMRAAKTMVKTSRRRGRG